MKEKWAERLNHRIPEAGSYLWSWSRPSLCLGHGHLQQVAQGPVQQGLEYPHNLSGQPVPVSDHPHNKKLYVSVEFLGFPRVLVAFWQHWELLRRAWLYLLCCPHHIFIWWGPSEPAPLEAAQSQLSASPCMTERMCCSIKTQTFSHWVHLISISAVFVRVESACASLHIPTEAGGSSVDCWFWDWSQRQEDIRLVEARGLT